mgnify:CR=1 FL=1
MKPATVIAGATILMGVSALAVYPDYFTTTAPDTITLAKPSEGKPENAMAPPPASALRTIDERRKIRARYVSTTRISSGMERDRAYGALVGKAVDQDDFELALDIANRISDTPERDSSYATIARRALASGDLASADRAIEKIVSVTLRDEQARKMAGACPANTVTEGAASILGLEDARRAGALAHVNRAASVR